MSMLRAFRRGTTGTLAVLALVCITRGEEPETVDACRVGERTLTVERSVAGTGSFPALVCFPAEGVDRPDPALDRRGAPYQAVVFGHGFLQSPSRYRSTMRALAQRGYIVIAPASETGFAPSHTGLAMDMRSCLTFLEHANSEAGSFLHGGVDTAAFGAMGHSMGGGCAILAASLDARVRALVPLAPAMTSASAVEAIARVEAPILIIVGSDDAITPTFQHAGPMYKAARAPKILLTVEGGFHCGFTDGSMLGCDSGAIDRADQRSIVNDALGQFFDLHLKGDERHRPAVWTGDAPPRTSRLIDAGAQSRDGGTSR